MKCHEDFPIGISDFRPTRQKFQAEVVRGLSKANKELPSKYFYDEKGSGLFEDICHLDEYYIPRTETAIMRAFVADMAGHLGPDVLLIEFGSGNSAKTRILLDHLQTPVGYVPIDICWEQLSLHAAELARDYPEVDILPVCADYVGRFELPAPRQPARRNVVFFPGSTIGNFDPIPAQQFLERVAATCGPGGALLIGVDLKKDPCLLHRAYNDRDGITAAFNLNLLERINRELGGDFRLERFEHYAFYNPREERVEMHLVSLMDQDVGLGDRVFHLARGESIWTESSYKYTPDSFSRLAGAAGFQIARTWTDEHEWFSVQYLTMQD